MPKTPAEMIEAVTKNLKEKTGRSLDEWIEVVRAEGPPDDEKAQRDWLKATHGLGHVQAGIVANHVAGGGSMAIYQDPKALVDAQYKGKKAALRPIYDALVHAAKRIGPDVKVAPCQTYVPLMRRKQFAVIKPTTTTRVDLGLSLPGIEPEGRLVRAKNLGGGDSITHRIPLETLKDVDAEVVRWLKRAYLGTAAKKAAVKEPVAAPKRRTGTR